MPRISTLPEATEVAGEDELAVVDASVSTTKKVKVNLIMPTGSVIDFAGTTAPGGWVLCHGQALNASANPIYQALYDVIGNTYGGSSHTDFVVPDLRGKTTAGKASSGTFNTLGASVGQENTTLANANLPQYTGNVAIHGGGAATVVAAVTGSGLTPGIARGNYRSGGGNTAGANSYDSFSLNIGQASPTPVTAIQPTVVLNKIMKY